MNLQIIILYLVDLLKFIYFISNGTEVEMKVLPNFGSICIFCGSSHDINDING